MNGEEERWYDCLQAELDESRRQYKQIEERGNAELNRQQTEYVKLKESIQEYLTR